MSARWIVASLFLLAGPAFAAGSSTGGAGRLVRVPQDARTLGAAVARVADGGVIELAAGVYPSPPSGFLINDARKGFTVRAAAGAAVAIDGGGSRSLLRFVNSDRARGKRVTFQRITFQNGAGVPGNGSGGVLLSAAEASFQGCSFVNNRTGAAVAGGGAVRVIAGSSATFVNSSFRGNSSPLRGGALEVISSQVTVQGGDFTANRTNLPGHDPASFGGGIMAIDSDLTVSGVRFEGNEAGWVGGAIYAIGDWDRGSTVSVTRSTFLRNQAVADPCCVNPEATSGGAIHAEDLTALRVSGSLFQDNRADLGGGIDEYRADVEVQTSVFQGNRRTDANLAGGEGGAIAATSSESVDPSAGPAAVNRRASRLVVTRSLIQGGVQAPYASGCVLVAGDALRLYGNGAVPPDGTPAENRARVEIRGVVFSDCDADPTAAGVSGMGGALVGDLVEADVEDSMFLDSDARGPNGAGGAMVLRQDSNAVILRATFAHDTAEKWGGALFLSGSTVQVDGCRFLGDDVAPGAFERLSDSRGAAIYSQPLINSPHPRNVGGVVSGSVFSENLGIPIWDVEPADGPVNDLRYDGNRFAPALFGDRVYVNNQAMPGGASVAELNFLTVFRGVRGTARKSAVANAQILGPREGDLRIVPSPDSVGASPSNPGWSVLAYAWTGAEGTIGTLRLGLKAGVFEAPPGSYTLVVDGVPVATATAAGEARQLLP
jgi:hypothetical protein